MVHFAESGKGVDPVSTSGTDRDRPTRWCVFREPQVRPVLVVQVDNLIPIVLNRESSFIRGIPGMGVLFGFMEPW
jgi:hypothetical protein